MNSLPLTSRIVFTLGFMALLALLSLTPGTYRPGDHIFIWLIAETPSLIHKILHILFYAMLAMLLVWTLEGKQSRVSRLLAALFITVAFGALMEWGQTRVPGRSGSLYEIALNTAGAAMGILVSLFLL